MEPKISYLELLAPFNIKIKNPLIYQEALLENFVPIPNNQASFGKSYNLANSVLALVLEWQ